MIEGTPAAAPNAPNAPTPLRGKPGGMSTLIAEATIAKVLGRWAPYARHDLMGGFSPMSMDVAALSTRNDRGLLTPEDITKFAGRMKESLKYVSTQADGLSLMVGQDRKARIAVGDVVRDVTHKLSIRFASMACELVTEDLGEDIRYDLNMMLLAVLMAMEDRRGLALRVMVRVSRDDESRLRFSILSAPLQDESWVPLRPPEDGRRRIDFADLECLATYLGFQFLSTPDGATLIRVSRA